MPSPDQQPGLTGGPAKAAQYLARYEAGNLTEEEINQLPLSFRAGIDAKRKQKGQKEIEKSSQIETKEDGLTLIPPQYEGFSAELLDEFWQIKPFIDDPEKTAKEEEKKARALKALKSKESLAQTKDLAQASAQKDQHDADEVRRRMGFPTQKIEASDPMQAEKERGKQIENALGSMASGIGEAAKAKIREYDARIRAALAGNPSRRGDTAQVLMEDFKSLAKKDWTEEFTVEKLEKPEDGQKGEAGAQGKREEYKILSLAERKKLSSWFASYELAKIAKQQGLDLSSVSREEYVNFAIKNSLAIDDDQLRAAPWQRMATSVEQLMKERKGKREKITKEVDMKFHNFSENMKKKAGEQDRFIGKDIRVRQGTETSNSWLFFGINNSTDRSAKETHKAYLSFKDLNTLSPEKVVSFLEALRDASYNGDVKTFQDLKSQGVVLNDQIVMHGRSEADARLALEVAGKFFKDDLEQKSFGKDEVIDGAEKSYSEILADKIKKEVGV